METVTHQGRETAYRRSDRGGDGVPLLCVHGSGGNKGVWKSQFRLADDRPVVAMDLSGHGDSDDIDADEGYSTLSAYADDVIAVAEETDAGVLVGNSLGGAVVMHVALERDFDPDALVLAGTGARLSVNEDLLGWLADDFDRAVEFLHEPGKLFDDPDDDLVDLSEAAMRECGRAVTARDFRTCHGFDVRDRVDEIAVPALAIVGENDRLTPPWFHEFLADELPDAALAVVDDAAHLAMLEQPGSFNAAVKNFLSGLE
ncbi:alpha/beta hydrolase [Halostella sp. JP-L12]|uniref:alpha/beta fold hydrolase n=1 Tax=Halostella TaxID=1843185 RepID=UPI000EF80FC0|nr:MULTISPECIES: alpha/beta hydrolase [Halostella]NHN48635.1 alpha/beta hydrolase [Halostella sp. JP-L12]